MLNLRTVTTVQVFSLLSTRILRRRVVILDGHGSEPTPDVPQRLSLSSPNSFWDAGSPFGPSLGVIQPWRGGGMDGFTVARGWRERKIKVECNHSE
jgi:hypothetical protein